MPEKQDEKPKTEGKPPAPPAQKELDRAKDGIERAILVNGKKVVIEEKCVWSEKEGGLVALPTVDDRVTNDQIRTRTYNRAFYEDGDNVKNVFDEGKWPEALRASLVEEQTKLENVLKRLLGERVHSATILDCGCGTGRHLVWEIDNFESVKAMDYSKAVLGFAAEKVADKGGYAGAKKIRLIAGDLKEIPAIDPNSIDVAICLFNTLGVINADYHEKIMAQVSRVLKMPTHESPSFFFFSFYMDNKDTQRMQAEYYTKGFGYRIKSLDVKEDEGENERHYALAENPDNENMTLKSQRFNRSYIEKILGNNFGILEFEEFGGIMAYAVAVPVKDKEKMGKELVEAVRAGKRAEAEVLLVCKASTEQRDPGGNTPLAIAAKNGARAIVEKLMSAGADVNAKNYKGETPLMHACENGKLEIAETLIKNKADIYEEDAFGESALMKACRMGHEKTVRLLLDANARMGCRIIMDWLDALACGDLLEIARVWEELATSKFSSPLLLAAENGHVGIVRILQEKRLQMLEKHDGKTGGIVKRETIVYRALEDNSEGDNAAIVAAKNGHLEIIKMLFECDLGRTAGSYANKDGITPLMAAASNGHEKIVEFLLKDKEYVEKAINKWDRDGRTALMHALRAKQFEISMMLIEGGADSNIPENTWDRRLGECPLHAAMYFDDSKAAKLAELMLARGANPNKPERDGKPPLAIACERGMDETTKVLLRGGANPNVLGTDNEPVVFNAFHFSGFLADKGKEWKGRNLKLLREFVKAGLDPNVRETSGGTLLHVAAQLNDVKLGKALVEEFNADVNAEDEYGRTPLHDAYDSYERNRIARLLLGYEERYNPRNRRKVRFLKAHLRKRSSRKPPRA